MKPILELIITKPKKTSLDKVKLDNAKVANAKVDNAKVANAKLDKELLTCAAKLAGLAIMWVEGYTSPFIRDAELGSRLTWNPLLDDGDALRLSVLLKIDVKHYDDYVVCWFDGGYIGTGKIMYEGNKYLATRRAIVLAACEISRKS